MLKEYDALSNYYNVYECNSATMLAVQCRKWTCVPVWESTTRPCCSSRYCSWHFLNWFKTEPGSPPPPPTYCLPLTLKLANLDACWHIEIKALLRNHRNFHLISVCRVSPPWYLQCIYLTEAFQCPSTLLEVKSKYFSLCGELLCQFTPLN